MARLWSGEVVSPGVSHTVTSWLRLNADLSMVAADWGLDPLAHVGSATLSLFNKTGSDAGVRADIGTLVGPAGSVSYAVIANWPADRPERAPAVYAAMRTIGAAIRDLIDPPESPR
jgi:beta-lactamase class A